MVLVVAELLTFQVFYILRAKMKPCSNSELLVLCIKVWRLTYTKDTLNKVRSINLKVRTAIHKQLKLVFTQ